MCVTNIKHTKTTNNHDCVRKLVRLKPRFKRTTGIFRDYHTVRMSQNSSDGNSGAENHRISAIQTSIDALNLCHDTGEMQG